MNLPIDRDFLVETLRGLVRINSINPTLVPGGAGEAEIAAYVVRTLQGIGLETQRYEPEAGRASVVGTYKGKRADAARALMLNAHYDTVGVDGMAQPFSGVLRDARLYGRGAYDMKGSLAACLTAAKALADARVPLDGDLLIAAVADEEYGSIGTADLVERIRRGELRVDAAIVTEPTSLRICLAHKGYIWMEVVTRGRAAHGSRFDLGVDANLRMGRFLGELAKLERRLRTGRQHRLVGPASLHAAMIEGGSGLSTYAAECRLKIERRTIPGETEKQAVGQVEKLVRALRKKDKSFRASVKSFFAREPFEVSERAEIVQTLRSAAKEVLGKAPKFFGDTPWMDAALFSAAGVETVVMGPHGAGAHAIEEWVDLESVAQLSAILARAAVAYCGTA